MSNGYRMGDAKMLDAMVHDGLTNPFSGKQMFVEVDEELEMTRGDLSTAGAIIAHAERERLRLPGERGEEATREGRPTAARHRHLGAQRGVHVGNGHSIRMLGIDEDRINGASPSANSRCSNIAGWHCGVHRRRLLGPLSCRSIYAA
jgi:hypothetical protein